MGRLIPDADPPPRILTCSCADSWDCPHWALPKILPPGPYPPAPPGADAPFEDRLADIIRNNPTRVTSWLFRQFDEGRVPARHGYLSAEVL
jgi:hypothetical protein